MRRNSIPSKILGFYLFFALYVLTICGGYFIDNKHATINKLASDNWSIVPLAQKISDSTLFLKDQFAGNSKAVRFYIPAFVNSALYLKTFTNGDIFQAYNVFNLIVVMLHIVLWFLVFLKLTRNHWLSFLFTMLMRGILWPPGKEIWGAGNLEYFLPRTVFAALLPLFFLALQYAWPQRKSWVPLAFLLLGLAGNFHPISGLGVGVASLFALFCSGLVSKDPFKKIVLYTFKSGLMLVLGLLPFIWLYLSKDLTQSAKAYDKALFSSLISERIGDAFLGPWQLYQGYLGPQWLFLILGSFLLTFLLRKSIKIPRQLLQFSWLLGAFVFIMPVFFYCMQLVAHAAGLKFLNFSYELSRNSKYVIVPCFLLFGVGLEALLRRSWPKYSMLAPAVLSVAFITMSVLSKWPLQQLPGLKADFFRAQMPDAITKTTYLPYLYEDLDSMLFFVKQHTPATATFAGPPQLRAGALRSVPFDYKGASVLLEQNKVAYIEWALLNKTFEAITTDSGQLAFYKKLPVDYLVSDHITSTGDSLLYQKGKWRLYKLATAKPPL
jgi:hypothetical protein